MKNRKNWWKKKFFENFSHLIFLIFLEFFSENVLKSLLRGRETTRKKYWIIFEKLLFLIKIWKNRWKKKVVRNFLTNLISFIFFEFFSENVLKTVLRGRETARKKYRIVFEKFLKYMLFFDFGCPSITHHPSPIHPSIHPSVNIKNFAGQKRAPTYGVFEIKKVHLG